MREEPIDLVKNWSFSRYGTQKRNEAKRLMNQIARYIARGKTLNAKNIVDCSLPDNLGQLKKNQKIIENEIEYIETLVNVSNLKDLIKFSTDAG